MANSTITRWLRPAIPSLVILLCTGILWMSLVWRDYYQREFSSSTNGNSKLAILHSVIVLPSLMAFGIYVSIVLLLRDAFERATTKPAPIRQESDFPGFPSIPTFRERLVKQKRLKLNALFQTISTPIRNVDAFIATSCSLYLVLTMRLFLGAKTFQGHPSSLDFGYEYGRVDGPRIVAFESTWSSCGSCTVGILGALFSFPIIADFMVHTVASRNACCCFEGCFKMIFRNAARLLCLYPVAQFLISIYYDLDGSWRYFAAIRYWAIAMEWSYGYMMGLALGNLTDAMSVHYHFRKIIDATHLDEHTDWDADDEQPSTTTTSNSVANPSSWWKLSSPATKEREEGYPSKKSCCESLKDRLVGLCLLATVVLSAVFSALSWNDCPAADEAVSCVNQKPEHIFHTIPLVVALLTLPSIAFVTIVWVRRLTSEEL